MGLSQLSERCRKCPFVDKCDHKRMEALAYLPEPQIAMNASQSAGIDAAQPLLLDYNMEDDSMTTDEWNALLNKLTEAWEQFAVTVRQAADTLAKIFGQIRDEEEKRAKEKAMFVPHCKKNQYLKNYTPRYKVERRKRDGKQNYCGGF